MAENQDKLDELTKILRENPRICPQCSGTDIFRDDSGAMIVGKRRCRKCGCYWLPPWSKSTVWLALGFVEFSVVLMVILILFVESPFLWNGEFSAKYAQAPKEAVKSLGLIILLILLGFGTLKYFIPYFKGKKGQGQVLEVGLFNEAQAAAQAAKQEEKK